MIALPGLLWGAVRLPGFPRAAAIAALALALAVVVLSGSRLQLVLALLVLAAGSAAACRPRFQPRRSVVAATGGGLLCAAVAAFALLPSQSNGSLDVDITHGRTDTWSAAVATATERPWLGSGAETFELASASNQGGTAVRYAHNLPLDAWVELGIAGLALVLGLYGAVGAAVWRARHRAESLLLGTGAVAFLLANLFDWSWHLAGLGAVWALCLGAIVAAQPRAPG